MSSLRTPEQARTSAALEIAAQSILESRALEQTVAEVIRTRALEHHWRGLFEYAAIRVGVGRAGELLTGLAELAEADPTTSGQGAPEHSARPWREYYVHLRRSLTGATPGGAAQAPNEGVFWSVREAPWTSSLGELRRALDAEQAEVAELHFARGLELADVAAITGASLERVSDCRATALQIAEGLLEDRSASAALSAAFALDPLLAPTPSRPARMPIVQPGDLVAGRYEIEALLGSGAFADVYRARDRDVEGHCVALKMSRARCLDSHSEKLALRELQLLASVFHPSVVQLKDHGWHERHLWFVMPLYRGETLAARLRRGPLERAEAQRIFAPLAEALATMHRAGVLHQDIKPDNIFLADIDPRGDAHEPDGSPPDPTRRVLPVLLDLGVAAKDAEIVLAGTPAYLAPEVAARFAGLVDPAPIGPKADVFALALTLRDALEPEAARGEPPFPSVDAFVAHRARTAPAPPQARELSDLRGAFTRWLHVRPDRRPSAAELREELSLLTAPAERKARRNATLRWLIPSAVAVACLFASVVYWLSQEATMRRLEAESARISAHRAREQVATIAADLQAQHARRKELEASIQRLEDRYRRSRMTREQLASRLAHTEGDLRMAGERLQRQAQRLQGLQTASAESAAQRAALEDQLRDKASHVAELQRQLARARTRVESSKLATAEQLLRGNRLEKRIIELELALEHSRSQLSDLRRKMAAPKIASKEREDAAASGRIH